MCIERLILHAWQICRKGRAVPLHSCKRMDLFPEKRDLRTPTGCMQWNGSAGSALGTFINLSHQFKASIWIGASRGRPTSHVRRPNYSQLRMPLITCMSFRSAVGHGKALGAHNGVTLITEQLEPQLQCEEQDRVRVHEHPLEIPLLFF